MIRILGGVLTAGVCLWLGDREARQLTARVDTLDSLIRALDWMSWELKQRLTPLPRLMEELGHCAEPPVRPMFQEGSRALVQLEEGSFAQAWEKLSQRLPGLSREDRSSLGSLSGVLGRWSGEEQGEAIRSVCRELTRNREQALQDSQRMGKVWRTVGAAGGGFLLILLL